MQQDNINDNELQAAINNIQKSEVKLEPIFTDPVAAPSQIKDGDTGSLEPMMPMPPEALGQQVAPVAPAPAAPAPAAPAVAGGFGVPAGAPGVAGFGAPSAIDTAVANLNAPGEGVAPADGAAAEAANSDVNAALEGAMTEGGVKAEACRELLPLLAKLDISAEEKFAICRKAYDELKEEGALAPALEAAKAIGDEKAKAEAMLYLFEHA